MGQRIRPRYQGLGWVSHEMGIEHQPCVSNLKKWGYYGDIAGKFHQQCGAIVLTPAFLGDMFFFLFYLPVNQHSYDYGQLPIECDNASLFEIVISIVMLHDQKLL